MKRQFAILAAAVFVVLAATLTASAQTSAPVYVPFSFTANHQILPPGFYRVSLLSDRYLAFINSKTGRTERVVMIRPEAGNKIESSGGLIFHSSGRHYTLEQISMAGSSMHSVLTIQAKPERHVVKNATETTLEIAMK
jgi:hypothetical protein